MQAPSQITSRLQHRHTRMAACAPVGRSAHAQDRLSRQRESAQAICGSTEQEEICEFQKARELFKATGVGRPAAVLGVATAHQESWGWLHQQQSRPRNNHSTLGGSGNPVIRATHVRLRVAQRSWQGLLAVSAVTCIAASRPVGWYQRQHTQTHDESSWV